MNHSICLIGAYKSCGTRDVHIKGSGSAVNVCVPWSWGPYHDELIGTDCEPCKSPSHSDFAVPAPKPIELNAVPLRPPLAAPSSDMASRHRHLAASRENVTLEGETVAGASEERVRFSCDQPNLPDRSDNMGPCMEAPCTACFPGSDALRSPRPGGVADSGDEGSAASKLLPTRIPTSGESGCADGASSSEAQPSLPVRVGHQETSQKYPVATEGIPGPNPLSYQSQSSTHRYRAPGQHGSILRRPTRSKTFPAQSSRPGSGHDNQPASCRAAHTLASEPTPGRSLPSSHSTGELENEVTTEYRTRLQHTALRYPEHIQERQVRRQDSEDLRRIHTTTSDVKSQNFAYDLSVARDDGAENREASNSVAVNRSTNGGNVSHAQPPSSGLRAQGGATMPSSGASNPSPFLRIEREDQNAQPCRHDAGLQAPGRHSINSSRRQPLPPPAVVPVEHSDDTYASLVDRLGNHMPQLVNTREHFCRVPLTGSITCYDTLSSSGPPRLVSAISYSTIAPSQIAESLKTLKLDVDCNVRSRHILVEDLSPSMIEDLGKTFWLNPEFFEEHLNRSGYRPYSYEDPLPSTWNTSGTPKDYVSVRWFRPAHRRRIKPVSESDRDRLLKKGTSNGLLKWFSLSDGLKFKNSVSLLTNIFRKEWPLVSDPEQAGWAADAETFPVAWEERATIHAVEKDGQPPVFIMLLDPLPHLHLTSRPIKPGNTSEDNINIVPFVQAYSRAPIGPKYGLVNVFNGLPLDEATISMLGSNIASTKCTQDDLTSWLESMHTADPRSADMDLVLGLLWIVHRDTSGFLRFVHTVLEEIGLHSTDDYILQARLTHWRGLITRFQTELPAMKLSITELFHFLQRFQPLDQAEEFVKKTIADLDGMIDQLEKSYTALRADMALLESKRGINQAESVGKLTELGFIFIPISCIASLFSMQVQPLAEPAPIYAVVVAILLTVGMIYAVRLCVRSTALEEYRREKAKEIRLYTKLSPGAPIPARTFILYMIRDWGFYKGLLQSIFGPITTLLACVLVLTACMLPVIMLWFRNKHMDVRYKSTLTVVIFVFCSAALYPLAKLWIKAAVIDPIYEREGQILKKLQGIGYQNERLSSLSASDERSSNTPLRRRHLLSSIAQRALGNCANRTPDAETPDTRSINANSFLEHPAGVRSTARDRRAPFPTAQPTPFSAVHRRDANAISRWRDDVTPDDGVELIEVIGGDSPTGQRRHDLNEVPANPARIPLPPSAETL